MKKLSYVLIFLMLVLGLVYDSCKKDSTSDLQNLMEIIVSPADTVIAVGQTVQYKAIGIFMDSSKRDITGEVKWISNPEGKITITSGGLATSIDTGATYVVCGAWGVVAGGTLLSTNSAGVERAKMLLEYTNNYLGSELNDCQWTGNTGNCDPGGVSAESHTKVRQRINYFRKLCGLNSDITLDAAKGGKCQKAALMFTANNQLNHYPPTTWTCYTADGAEAAGNSNIALGMHSVNAVTGFIEDFGDNNKAVGHRRWLLYSSSKVMAHGSTDNASAIWVIQENPSPWSGYPEFVAYPPKGYVPQPLVFDRWSCSALNADFTAATVTMKDAANANVALQVISNDQTGVGDNSIVWEPAGINLTANSDVKYSVTVSNVKVGGNTKTFNYDVIIVKPGTKKSSYEVMRAIKKGLLIK